MIPRLDQTAPASASARGFLNALRERGFAGDIHADFGTRLVHSTDNSIYQLIPEAVLAPRHHDDVVAALTLLADPGFREVALTPRGGGTGTNAQSLTEGIVLDLSRHMNRIIDLDPDARTARVQPGVILDQLNRAAKEHGLMFAPTVSTASRATIGGMIANDSAGKGSRVYGKTSQHVLELTSVFRGGLDWTSGPVTDDELDVIKDRDDAIGALHRVLDQVIVEHAAEIDRVFPKLNRFLTGYNLAMLRDNTDEQFNLNYLLCGSEGTLAVTTEALLRLTPIPSHRTVVLIQYDSFDAALGSAAFIAPDEPDAVETMDDKLLNLARDDEAWLPVAHLFPDEQTQAINLVEFAGDDLEVIQQRAQSLVDRCRRDDNDDADHIRHADILETDAEINACWTLRSRSVGLLGNMPGRRKPRAFVEDSVVPPEHLREFVREFRAMLDAEGLTYGMFGHVDVGVLHVRPALDLVELQDQARIRTISDAVVQLSQKHGGVLWGEHGKGVRGAYNETLLGPTITNLYQRIKGVADPCAQLNPGKIAAPADQPQVLLTIESTTRGDFDRHIDEPLRDRFDEAINCNGNGQCHNLESSTVMCPSWKHTHDRIHTPKGRASMMREWLRQISVQGGAQSLMKRGPELNVLGRLWNGVSRWRGVEDFSHEVHDAMSGCLACKGCTGQCPVKVDVPDLRAEFLQAYHDRYPRRLRDHVIGRSESSLVRAARRPRLAGLAMKNPLTSLGMRLMGLRDMPHVASENLAALAAEDPIPPFDCAAVSSDAVVLLPDAFTLAFEPQVILALRDVARALDVDFHMAPFRPSGKTLHVRGFVRRFESVARRMMKQMRTIDATGATMVSIDPAITLTYRDEYRRLDPEVPRVLMVQEWLAGMEDALRARRGDRPAESVRLLSHCTERALEPRSTGDWKRVFESAGMTLDAASVGCCGMCGAYGHESEHIDDSRGIYDQSWAAAIENASNFEPVATGYSCRSQVKRIEGRAIRHPIEVLAASLSES